MRTSFVFDTAGNLVDNQPFFMMPQPDYPIANPDLATTDTSIRFPCPKCTSVFRQKGSLTRHLKYECQKPPRFKCPYCFFCSKKTSDAYDHVRKKHRDQEVYIIDIEAPSTNVNVLRPKL